MSNNVLSDKTISVIVVLLVGGIIVFTNGTALGFEGLDLLLFSTEGIIPPNILPFNTPQETSPVIPEPVAVPEPVVVPDPVVEVPVVVPEPVVEIPPEIIIEIVPEPPKESLSKIINLNELTEADLTDIDPSTVPLFKTFKEEVMWYSALSKGETLDVPQECDPVVRLYKQTTELYAKASLAETILEVCDL